MVTIGKIVQKLHEGKQLPMKAIVQLIKKPMATVCVKPTFAYGTIVQSPNKPYPHIEHTPTSNPNEIIIITGNTQQLKKAGIQEQYGGWSHSEKRGNKMRREIFINTDTKIESQIITLAHEIGHHVLKGAESKRVGKRTAEKRAMMFERTVIGEYNRTHGKKKGGILEMKKTGEIKATINDIDFVKANIKPIFLNHKCQRSKL